MIPARWAAGSLAGVLLVGAACSGDAGGPSRAGEAPPATAAATTTADSDPEPSPTGDPATGGDPAPADGRTGSAGGEIGSAVAALSPWEGCGERVECAQLTVPLDHRRPDGETIGIDVARRRATGDRLGIVIVNPGGPGASGVRLLRGADAVPERVADRFDQVSFDPRGVHGTNPLDCHDELLAFYAIDHLPDDPAEAATLDDAAREVAAACEASGGELLAHISTVDVARDMDLLRQALDEPEISYIGFSYGTLLGQRYAALFPDRVRAMVLDGVVDPSDGLTGLLAAQAEALEGLLDRVFASCAGFDPCAVDDPEQALLDLLDASDRGEGPASDDGPLGPAELVDAVVYASYDPATHGSLVEAVADGQAGDGRLLGVLSDLYRDFEGWDVYTAVSCVDSIVPRGTSAFGHFADRLEAESPVVGAAIANELLPCAHWPVGPVSAAEPVSAPGTPPILVVGNTGDVATPYASAVAVAETLSDAVLVTYDGEGHTSLGRSECIDEVIAEYLIDLVVPDPGARCPGS